MGVLPFRFADAYMMLVFCGGTSLTTSARSALPAYARSAAAQRETRTTHTPSLSATVRLQASRATVMATVTVTAMARAPQTARVVRVVMANHKCMYLS
jgi:hypothetical protein